MSALKDISGQRFGLLTVIGRNGTRILPSGDAKPLWECKCDCGNTRIVRKYKLVKGLIKSCGCDKHIRNNRVTNAALNSLYTYYKCKAGTRNLSFELTPEEFESIIQKDCHYCGTSPSQEHKVKRILNPQRIDGSILYNGIDRVINSIGYIYKNCVPCCGTCNMMKSDMVVEDFFKKIEAIYLRMK